MKIVVGVDTDGTYKAALNLATRLKFSNPSWVLAHSVETIAPLGGYGLASEEAYAVGFTNLAQQAGDTAIKEAHDAATANGMAAETALLNGNAAYSLMQYADDMGGDLICVHSERKGRLGSLFFGSVSRGLAIGAKQSVLISKGTIEPQGSVSVVFAMDHSDYSKKSLDKFIQMAPKGIENIRVITAMHLNEDGGYFDPATMQSQVEKHLVEPVAKEMKETLGKLSAAGYSCTGAIVNLGVNQAISQEMLATSADLLVLGAQGHGFTHRLTMGSTSLYQVVVEPYSVLIVRP